MHLSEARAELYEKVFDYMHRGETEQMSRLPHKHGYTAGEIVELEPFEWSVSQVGYLHEVKVIYRTGDGKLETLYEQVPGMKQAEETLQEMLARRSITYPK